ncbi:hypothetical protein KCU83_g610, partial [Aureobasidium melanogenum]
MHENASFLKQISHDTCEPVWQDKQVGIEPTSPQIHSSIPVPDGKLELDLHLKANPLCLQVRAFLSRVTWHIV